WPRLVQGGSRGGTAGCVGMEGEMVAARPRRRQAKRAAKSERLTALTVNARRRRKKKSGLQILLRRKIEDFRGWIRPFTAGESVARLESSTGYEDLDGSGLVVQRAPTSGRIKKSTHFPAAYPNESTAQFSLARRSNRPDDGLAFLQPAGNM